MPNPFKLYRVQFKATASDPRVAYVEALSLRDAINRTKSRWGRLSVDGVELVNDGNCVVFLPVGDRERAEVEAEAARIGLS